MPSHPSTETDAGGGSGGKVFRSNVSIGQWGFLPAIFSVQSRQSGSAQRISPNQTGPGLSQP